MAHFLRRKPAPPIQGGYSGFRPFVRQDFRETCAYCLLEEFLAAGAENFELDHFRPRSLFPHFQDDYYNLYYACHPCNRIKHQKWPSLALEALGIGFVDLCADDFSTHFQELDDGRWIGLTLRASFTIDALRLNRAHLVEIRYWLRQPKPAMEDSGPAMG